MRYSEMNPDYFIICCFSQLFTIFIEKSWYIFLFFIVLRLFPFTLYGCSNSFPFLHWQNQHPKVRANAVTSTSLPFLVIACNRVTVKRTLDLLLLHRSRLPSAIQSRVPIIVSLGCGHQATASVVRSYGAAISVITFTDSVKNNYSRESLS